MARVPTSLLISHRCFPLPETSPSGRAREWGATAARVTSSGTQHVRKSWRSDRDSGPGWRAASTASRKMTLWLFVKHLEQCPAHSRCLLSETLCLPLGAQRTLSKSQQPLLGPRTGLPSAEVPGPSFQSWKD